MNRLFFFASSICKKILLNGKSISLFKFVILEIFLNKVCVEKSCLDMIWKSAQLLVDVTCQSLIGMVQKPLWQTGVKAQIWGRFPKSTAFKVPKNPDTS